MGDTVADKRFSLTEICARFAPYRIWEYVRRLPQYEYERQPPDIRRKLSGRHGQSGNSLVFRVRPTFLAFTHDIKIHGRFRLETT